MTLYEEQKGLKIPREEVARVEDGWAPRLPVQRRLEPLVCSQGTAPAGERRPGGVRGPVPSSAPQQDGEGDRVELFSRCHHSSGRARPRGLRAPRPQGPLQGPAGDVQPDGAEDRGPGAGRQRGLRGSDQTAPGAGGGSVLQPLRLRWVVAE